MRLISLLETTLTDSRPFQQWFRDSKVVDQDGEPLVVYHGTNKRFQKFDRKKSIGGLFWFTTDRSSIESGDIGAAGSGHILEVYLSIQNPAGWDEYHKYFTEQLISMGYDGLALPGRGETTYVAFDPRQIKAVNNRGNFDATNPRLREADLMELRNGYSPEDFDPKHTNGTVIAWRGWYWIIPEYDGDEVPDETLAGIAQIVGWDGYNDGFDSQDFASGIQEFALDYRPDIIVANIQQGQLYVDGSILGGHDPVTSSMIKKLVQTLGVSYVNVSGKNIDPDGDDSSDLHHPRELTGKLPEVLYHGTNSQYLISIARTGLRPAQSPSNWASMDIHHESLIFGAVTPSGTEFHANQAAGMQHDPDDNQLVPGDMFPVIIEFRIPDQNLIVPDYDIASAVVGRTDHTDRLGYTNNADFANHRADGAIHHNPEGRMWKSTGIFGYAGRIPPSYITRVFTNFYDGPIHGNTNWQGTLREFFAELHRIDTQYYAEMNDEGDEDDDKDY